MRAPRRPASRTGTSPSASARAASRATASPTSAGSGLHGNCVNQPARGMTGWNWDGSRGVLRPRAGAVRRDPLPRRRPRRLPLGHGRRRRGARRLCRATSTRCRLAPGRRGGLRPVLRPAPARARRRRTSSSSCRPRATSPTRTTTSSTTCPSRSRSSGTDVVHRRAGLLHLRQSESASRPTTCTPTATASASRPALTADHEHAAQVPPCRRARCGSSRPTSTSSTG